MRVFSLGFLGEIAYKKENRSMTTIWWMTLPPVEIGSLLSFILLNAKDLAIPSIHIRPSKTVNAILWALSRFVGSA